jgi:glycosyltransferase involved in cell wall biosynthesis
MQNNSLVSIITPTFNSEKYIQETIKSVQGQSYKNWEMIITDDGSTDTTMRILSRLSSEDNRIKVYRFDENRGPAKSRNNSIRVACGRYLTFLDGDDLWKPNFIENCLEFLKEKNTEFVFSSYHRVDQNLNPLLSDFIVSDCVSYKDLLKSCEISCLTAFIDISRVGKKFMPDLPKRQDYGLWLKYLKEIPLAFGIKEPLAYYRMRPCSLSRNKAKLIRYQWAIYRHFEQLGFIKSFKYLLFWAFRGFLKYRR